MEERDVFLFDSLCQGGTSWSSIAAVVNSTHTYGHILMVAVILYTKSIKFYKSTKINLHVSLYHRSRNFHVMINLC